MTADRTFDAVIVGAGEARVGRSSDAAPAGGLVSAMLQTAAGRNLGYSVARSRVFRKLTARLNRTPGN